MRGEHWENGQNSENRELKVPLDDWARTYAAAEALADTGVVVEHQRDVYFDAPEARLKLRSINQRQHQLVWYSRPDEPEIKTSRYLIAALPADEPMRQILRLSLGELGEVVKRRHIFLRGNVRIHLDQVEGLGEYAELEGVISTAGSPDAAPVADAAETARRLDFVCQCLALPVDAACRGSYFDLLAARRGADG